jgi:hypothetical protein
MEFANQEPVPGWARRESVKTSDGDRTYYQTDARGFIGRLYLSKNLGHRVCQIYCSSVDWDTSQFPEGFFDTILVDGGHTKDVVVNDTRKALRLLRPGGLILWHDFYISSDLRPMDSPTHGVHAAIEEVDALLSNELSDLFWIDPSWILVGVKKKNLLWNLKQIFLKQA